MIAYSWFRQAVKRTLVSAVKPTPTTKLALKPLEDRTTPAGNVTAFVGDGILYVVGDAADNQVWVAGTGRRSAIVRPLGDTTLNGGLGEVRLGDIRGYHIQLLGGADTVVASGINTPGSLTIFSDDGDDSVNVLGVQVRRQTVIDTGAGNDDLFVTGSNFRGTAIVNAGAGDDAVTIRDTRFLGTVAISGGPGTDTLGLDSVYFRRPLAQDGFEQVFPTALPRANNDVISVAAGQSVQIAVTANDIARSGTLDLGSVVVTTGPASGTAVANPDGTVTYTAGASASGTDIFRYTVRNSAGAVSNEATVTINVTGSTVSPPTIPPVSPPVIPPPPADTTAPTVILTSTAADPTNVLPIPFTVTFDEDVTGLGEGGLVVTNGVVVGFTAVDARTYTFGVSPTGQGVVTASVAAGAVRDLSGNANAASQVVSRTYDTIAPTAVAQPTITNQPNATVTGTTDDSDAIVTVTLNGQTVTAVVRAGTFVATLQSPLAEGTYTVDVTATDRAGNVSTSTLPNGLVIDLTAPTAVVTSSAAEPTNISPIPFSVTFSEDVTGFSAAGVAVANGTVVNFSQTDPRTYSFGVIPNGNGAVSVSAAGGAARDAAGNVSPQSDANFRTFSSGTVALTADRLSTNDTTPTLTGTVGDPTAIVRVTAGGQTVTATVTGDTWSATLPSALEEGTYDIQVTATDSQNNVGSVTQTGGLVIDLTAPTAVVATTGPALTNSANIPFTLTFSEDVTGFDLAGLTVTNGTADDFSAVDARTYTFTVTPTADGEVTVTVAAGGAQDLAGNPNAASESVTVTSDRTAPTPTVSSTAADPTGVNPIPFTVTFTEDVSVFTAEDVTVDSGAVAEFVSVYARTYTFNVVPAAAGVVTVSVPAGSAIDAAGNVSQASNTVTREFNGTVVTPTVSTTATSPTNLAPIPFTVTFSDDVTGFELTDLRVSNGTAADFQAVDVRTYTFSVTPTADGAVTVNVPAGAVVAPNGTPTAAGSLVLVSDRTAPVATLTSSATEPTSQTAIPMTVTFGEDVSGFDSTKSVVTNGALSNFVAVSARVYTFDVTPTVDGPVTVDLPAGAALNAAGNPSGTATYNITSDRTAPDAPVVVGLDAASDSGTAGDGVTNVATPTFIGTAEAGAVVAVFADTGSGTVSLGTTTADENGTWALTSASPLADGNYAVTATATDPAGNASPVSSAFALTIDTLAPAVTLATATTDPTKLLSLPFTVTFDVDTPGFTKTDLSVTNGTINNFTKLDDRTYTFDVTPTADGAVSVTVAAGVSADAAGNTNAAVTASVVSDRTDPTGEVSASSPTAAAEVQFTVTFDEEVTDLDPDSLSVSNGSVGGVTRVGLQSFSVAVTPAGDGPVTLIVSAGAVVDLAGNGSAEVSGTATSDQTPPTVVIDLAPTGAVTGTSADATTGVAEVAASVFDGTAYWDGTAFASDTEVFLEAATTDGYATWSYAFPTPGIYTVRVRATDVVGNQSFTSDDVTVG